MVGRRVRSAGGRWRRLVKKLKFLDVEPSQLLVNMKLAHEKPPDPTEPMEQGEKACRDLQTSNPREFLTLLKELEKDHWTKVLGQAKINEAAQEKIKPVDDGVLEAGPQEALTEEMLKKLLKEWP